MMLYIMLFIRNQASFLQHQSFKRIDAKVKDFYLEKDDGSTNINPRYYYESIILERVGTTTIIIVVNSY